MRTGTLTIGSCGARPRIAALTALRMTIAGPARTRVNTPKIADRRSFGRMPNRIGSPVTSCERLAAMPAAQKPMAVT